MQFRQNDKKKINLEFFLNDLSFKNFLLRIMTCYFIAEKKQKKISAFAEI